MTVVAEGVEEPEQLALLHSLKCEYGQGYLFGKPMAADDAVNVIETGHRFPRAA